MSNKQPERDWNWSLEGDQYFARLSTKTDGFMRRAALVPPNTPGSIEWLQQVGKFWRQERQAVKLSFEETASLIPTDTIFLKFFEFGFFEPEVARGDFPQRYAVALKKPELYQKFCERFEITPYQPNKEE